jgi:peroxiredoxin
MAAYRQNRMLTPGERAPDFDLRDDHGHTRSLRELVKSGPVLVAFFKTTCPVCQLAFPFLDRIHRGQPMPLISVFGVSQDDAEATREFTDEFGVAFPILFDTADTAYPASNAYGISHVPSMFLVEPDGVISWTMEGFEKKALETLGAKAGVATFTARDQVPVFKAG